jgi:hypothetical protein
LRREACWEAYASRRNAAACRSTPTLAVMKFATTRTYLYLASTLLFLSANADAAACDDGGEIPTSATTYGHKRKIMEAVDGLTSVDDTVRLWRRGTKSLCFAVDTAHTNLHLCSIGGEAKRTRPNVYVYADTTCKVEIQVEPRKLTLRVTDPADSTRRLCNPIETFGCGANTAIQSGVFARRK